MALMKGRSNLFRSGIVLIVLVFMSSAVSAGDWSMQDETVNYRDSFSPTIECSSDCPRTADFELRICGETETSYVGGNRGGSVITGPSDMNFGDLKVPNDMPCALGSESMTLKIDEGDTGSWDQEISSQLDVRTKQGGTLNIAKFIYAEVNYDTDTMRYMFLSNGETDRSRPPSESPFYSEDEAYVFIAQHDGFADPDEEIYFRSRDVKKAVEDGNVEGLRLEENEALNDILNQTQYNLICPEGSGDKPNYCDVAEKSFLNSYDYNFGHIPDTGDQAGLHRWGAYQPDGEIMKGYMPSDPDSGPFFWVCREGMDGVTLSLSESGGFPKYRCDLAGGPEAWRYENDGSYPETGDWDRVYACSDDIDNDGDRAIDMDDSVCQEKGWDGESEEWTGSGTCDPVITYMADGSLVGNYSGEYKDECEYQESTVTYSEFLESRSIEQFNCVKDKTNYDAPHSDQKLDFCQGADYADHLGYSSSLTVVTGEQLPAVIYYAPSSVLYDEFDTGIYTNPVGLSTESEWVTDTYNGWTPKIQSVHQAEKKYSNGTTHEAWYWGSGTESSKGLVDTDDGYTPGNTADVLESWTIGNITGEGNSKIGDSRFEGGFAGKCPSGQKWSKNQDGEWTCSGNIPWEQRVYLPSVQYTGNETTIGFFILPYNVRERASPAVENEFGERGDNVNIMSHKEAEIDFLGSGDLLEGVQAACWPSDNGFRPSFTSSELNEGVWFGIEIKNFNNTGDAAVDEPIPVYGPLKMRNNQTYKCEWRYTTSETGDYTDSVATAGSVRAMKPGNAGDADTSWFVDHYESLQATPYGGDELKRTMEDLIKTSFESGSYGGLSDTERSWLN